MNGEKNGYGRAERKPQMTDGQLLIIGLLIFSAPIVLPIAIYFGAKAAARGWHKGVIDFFRNTNQENRDGK